MGYNILIIVVLLGLSAFFSASETAIFSLSKLTLRNLKQRYKRAQVIKKLLQRPTRLLSAIVFGNLLFNIGISSLATAIFVKKFGSQGLIFAIIFSGLIILFFGEIFPKIFAIYAAKDFSLLASSVLNIFSKIFFPLIVGIEKVVNYFSDLLIKIPKKKTAGGQEFKTALLLSKKGGHISQQEEEMISYVLEFKETDAGEILTARVDIEGIEINSSQKEVMDSLRKAKHSKLPVYQESLDNIKGIIYAKDVFLNPEKNWSSFLKEPIFIPESKKIDDLLKLFLKEKANIAVVLDEYGGTEGMITLEDVVEEIFGEIYDEFESVQEPVRKISKNSWRVYGKTPIKTVNIELGLDIPEDEDTIAGFLLSKAEKIPKAGEKFKFNIFKNSTNRQKKVEFEIERATVRRIVSVIITVLDAR
ncbi:MAG: hemolysin family protein [Candidatus Omnitrophica bacterium]|nr:hemolysin family protein [Candidatus Omnitrophota bacterium]MCF7878757.1 hemolysin family protein [Candidatus Omnitrophota bacterium]MCF7892870.1 hemolysin family protein [Candidatus Omnitrophota bacterium]